MQARKGLLFDSHRDLGANFESAWGWMMPESYGSVAEEVDMVHDQAGLLDLSWQGVLKITGGEAMQFLQGLLTNDVTALQKNKGMRAAFLTGNGKVRAFCVVLGLGDGFLILNDPQTHEKVNKQIAPFAYAGDFQVEDVTDNYQSLSLQGPRSHDILKEVCFEPVQELREYEWLGCLIAGQQVVVLRRSRTVEIGFEILVPASGLKDVWDYFLMKGKYHSLKPVGHGALNVLRSEAVLPVYGIDIDETNMVLEAGLDDAISFNKGCYTGQEAVAMATYRGHVSKKLSAILVDKRATLKVGDTVLKVDKEIGKITSFVYSKRLDKKIALALIKYGYFDDGNEVQVRTEHGNVAGSIKVKPL
jgi:folate-binding protein YgfZ